MRLGIDYGTQATRAVLTWPDGRWVGLLFDCTLPPATRPATSPTPSGTPASPPLRWTADTSRWST